VGYDNKTAKSLTKKRREKMKKREQRIRSSLAKRLQVLLNPEPLNGYYSFYDQLQAFSALPLIHAEFINYFHFIIRINFYWI